MIFRDDVMAGGSSLEFIDNDDIVRFVAMGTSAFDYDDDVEMRQRRVTGATTGVTYINSLAKCDVLNTTVTSRKPTSKDDVIFYVYFYGLMGFLTLVNLTGNTVVISSILRHRQLRLPANYFLFSMACSDLLLGIIYPISNVSHIDRPEIQRVLGDWMLCTTTMTIYMGLQSISAFTLVGVAVTRFISIRNPLKFQTIVTRARVINVLIITWTGLFLLSGALYFRTTSSKKYSRMCRYEFVQRVSDMMATSVTSVFLPLIVMAVLYGFMLIEAKKHVIAMAQSRGSTGGHSGVRRYIIRKELRMVVMTGLLLGYFALAWIPFVVYEFYAINRCSSEIDRDKCEPDRYVRATVRLILHSNSAINFFIYAVRMRDFQAAFRSDLRRLLSASRCSRTPSLIGENVCSARLAKLYPETDIELRASGDTSSQSGNDVTPIHVRPEMIGEASPQQLVTTL